MMNKYEEALKKLVKASCPEKAHCDKCDFSGLCNKEAKEWIDTLCELVEKETTKPLDYEGDGYVDGELNYDTAICRSCGRKFDVDYDEHSKYCPGCGQKLDWGESDE